MSLGTLDASLSLSSALERGNTLLSFSLSECVYGHHHFLVVVVVVVVVFVQFGVVGVCGTPKSSTICFRGRLSMVAVATVGDELDEAWSLASGAAVVSDLLTIPGR